MATLARPDLSGAVIVITGVQAAGKSTVAQELAERLPRAAHIRGNLFRRMVVSGREEMTDPPSEEAVRQLRLRYRIATGVADAYAAAGFTAILQDVILEDDLPAMVGSVRARPVLLVVLDPDADTVTAREAARSKTAYRAGITVGLLQASLRQRTPRLGLWLDNSGQTPAQTVDEILARGWREARIEH